MNSLPSHIREHETISGIFVADIRAYSDSRGTFMESFRNEWFPWINWEKIQSNCSISQAGVLRGLHYHFHQIDYWFVIRGRIQVGLADLRSSSPTFQQTATLELSEENRLGLFIPTGVAHGFLARTDATLTYLVNNYYDGADENGVAWNDPDFAVSWDSSSPNISERDIKNPRYKDLPVEKRPG
ncbi:MAG: dTDP-4-dehydrorhamnose 3,5-epimerase family protein [Anaerolineae bacterium]|nr:dTDP-4-dehydrorhamnose 3,5-epimerase family protein [Anaerolineae bacterium]